MKIVYSQGDRLRLKSGILDGEKPLIIFTQKYTTKDDQEKFEKNPPRRDISTAFPAYPEATGTLYHARLNNGTITFIFDYEVDFEVPECK